MYTRFLQYAVQNRILDGKSKILLAVSGGIDSVVMLHLFTKMLHSGSIPLKLFIAHCNFHLRGSDSDKDQLFVAELAQNTGIPFFTVDFDTIAYASSNSISIEMAARELRYKFFKEIIDNEGIDACALAHHSDDQAETIFINMLRGTGIKGLRGMEANKKMYIRPLLFARRLEIENYSKTNALEYREDYTNKGDDYLRNRIRHNLLPLLEEMNPQSIPHISQMASSLQRTESVIKAWYIQAYSEIVEKTGEEEFISKAKLKKWRIDKDEKNLLCFFELYLKERNFNIEQIEQILSNLIMGEGNKVFENRFGEPRLKRNTKGWIYKT